jgi:hypothetical protein
MPVTCCPAKLFHVTLRIANSSVEGIFSTTLDTVSTHQSGMSNKCVHVILLSFGYCV